MLHHKGNIFNAHSDIETGCWFKYKFYGPSCGTRIKLQWRWHRSTFEYLLSICSNVIASAAKQSQTTITDRLLRCARNDANQSAISNNRQLTFV
jgi:hypothetical protein